MAITGGAVGVLLRAVWRDVPELSVRVEKAVAMCRVVLIRRALVLR